MNNSFQQDLSNILVSTIRSNSWTGIFTAKLGDGQVPATVIVPVAKRERAGMMYCHRVVDQTREVFQALNLSPSISYTNDDAFLTVQVGYPPNSNILSIYMPSTEAPAMTGGPLPSQTQANNARFIDTGKLTFMKLYPYSGFTIGCTGGWWRIQNKMHRLDKNDNFLSLSGYVPETTSTSKWLMISLSEIGIPDVREGSDFSSSDPNPFNYVPAVIPFKNLFLGYVKMDYGMTSIGDSNLISIPDLLFVPTDDASDLPVTTDSTSIDEFLFSESDTELDLSLMTDLERLVDVDIEMINVSATQVPISIGVEVDHTIIMDVNILDTTSPDFIRLITSLKVSDALGADAILNGLFIDWTGSDPNAEPDDWTYSGDQDADNYTQDALSALRLVAESTGNVALTQSTLTVGVTYQLSMAVSDVTAGTLKIFNGTTEILSTSVPGLIGTRFVATSTSIKITHSGASDFTLSEFSAFEVLDEGSLPQAQIKLYADPGAETYSGRVRLTRITT